MAFDPYASSDVDDFGDQRVSGPWDLTWMLFSFEGRMSVAQAWTGFVLVLVGCAMVAVGATLIGGFLQAPEDLHFVWVFPMIILYAWSSLAMRVKRWHDLGYSGFMVFITLIPYLGGLIEFVMTGFFPGEPNRNRFGAPVGHPVDHGLDDDAW